MVREGFDLVSLGKVVLLLFSFGQDEIVSSINYKTIKNHLNSSSEYQNETFRIFLHRLNINLM